MNPAAPARSKITVVEAGRPASNFWREIWEYRELLYLLAWRDVSVRYKQTVLGVAWAVLRPALTTAALVLVFSYIARVPSGGIPYALLVLSGLLPWQLIATAVSAASESLLTNSTMLSKVYFPRLLFPLGAAAASVIDFAVGLLLFIMLMAWYGFVPDWHAIAIIPFFILALCLALAFGVLLCAANAKYRDFRYVVPFLVLMGTYLSPVGYPIDLVPERWRPVYALNPAVGVIEGFRWSLLREGPLDLTAVGISCAYAVVFLAIALAYFRSVEKSIVDLL